MRHCVRHYVDSPRFLAKAVATTVPMVGWMLFRGHGRRASADMSAAMFVPVLGVLLLLWAELPTDTGTLMAIEHVAMLAAMAGARALRPHAHA